MEEGKALFRAIIVFFITQSGIVRKDGSMYLQNVSICLQEHTVSPTIRPHSPSTAHTNKTVRDLTFSWHMPCTATIFRVKVTLPNFMESYPRRP
jgi:hypothetical protein